MPEPMAKTIRPASRWWLLLLTVVALAAILTFYNTTVADSDLWWHLAYGRDVVEQSTLTVDHASYSWTELTAPWVYVSWLGDSLLFIVHRLGSETGLRLLQLALYLGLAGLFLQQRRRHLTTEGPLLILLVMLAFLVMKPSAVILKNSMFSAFYAGIVLAVYAQARNSRGDRFWLLPLIILAWVNTHGEVILGVTLLGLITGGEVLLRLLKQPSTLSPASFKHLIAAALASLAMLALTPEGLLLPAYWLGRFGSGAPLAGAAVVKDVLPTHHFLSADRLQSIPRAATTWIWLGMTITFGLAILQGIRERRWQDLPLALAGVAFTTSSWFIGRLLLLAPLVWLFAMTPVLDHLKILDRPRIRHLAPAGILALALGCVMAKTLVYYESDWTGPRLSGAQPVAAARFIQEHDLPGPLFNDYQTGGHLIWALGPQRPVYIDPRYSPYDPAFRAAYAAFQTQPTRESLDTLHQAHPFATAMMSNVDGFRMAHVFQIHPQWTLVHLSSNAVIYVHQNHLTPSLMALSQDAIQADRFSEVSNLSTLIGLQNVASAASPGETLRLYRIMQRNVPGTKLLKARTEANLAKYFETHAFTGGQGNQRLTADQVKQRFAMYYLDGQLDIARLVATGYLNAHPDDAGMHYNLACVEARSGDLTTARRALSAALKHGYDKFDTIRADADLAPLREQDDIESLLAGFERRGTARAAS